MSRLTSTFGQMNITVLIKFTSAMVKVWTSFTLVWLPCPLLIVFFIYPIFSTYPKSKKISSLLNNSLMIIRFLLNFILFFFFLCVCVCVKDLRIGTLLLKGLSKGGLYLIVVLIKFASAMVKVWTSFTLVWLPCPLLIVFFIYPIKYHLY